MKLTKSQLRKIIKEEVQKTLDEAIETEKFTFEMFTEEGEPLIVHAYANTKEEARKLAGATFGAYFENPVKESTTNSKNTLKESGKPQLRKIIKEELLKDRSFSTGRIIKEDLDKLRTIAYWMEENGIYDPLQGVEAWVTVAREAGEEIAPEMEKALLDNADQIYSWM